ncbi:hypothetical protein B0O99DRAFT_644396 [Bisporella sp. PMI_857]|nr:hypothetical protein B0O99DRAFT_644396 [Bisporella sp. PMI_857]
MGSHHSQPSFSPQPQHNSHIYTTPPPNGEAMNINAPSVPYTDNPSRTKKAAQAQGQTLPSYPGFSTTFASVSLHRRDTLRFLRFPQQDVEGLRRIIRSAWAKGIQEERIYGGSHEIKLYGNPWGSAYSDSVTSRILMLEVFAYLFSIGWILHASTDVSKKQWDKDTLIFRKQQTPPPPSEWISVSFHRMDRLRLTGATPQLTNMFREVLQSMRRLQSEEWKDRALNAYEFKIVGYPWSANGEETMVTRMLILKMLDTLERDGWSLYASIDQNVSAEDTSEADCWYCVRDKAWMPGGSVFHR